MRNFFLTALIAFFAFNVRAQTTTPHDTLSSNTANWQIGGTASLMIAQGGTRNWAPGGDRFTLAANGFLNLYANRVSAKTLWYNTLDANYGLVNTSRHGLIKNDDKLDFVSNWSHSIGAKSRIRYGAFLNFRTQFVDGYDYDETAKRRISSFLAPGIISFSPGFQFHTKDKSLTTHIGPAARWVLVANRPYELAANYGVMPNRQVRIEAGFLSSIGYNKEVMKNVFYRTRLDLFSDFIHQNPTNIDVFWTNMLHLRVNSCIAVVYNLDLQYDDNTRLFGWTGDRPGAQLKSILGVGLSVNF